VDEGELVFGGRTMYYALAPGVLRLWEDSVPFDYPIRVDGDRLRLSLADDRELVFRRSGDTQASSDWTGAPPAGISGQATASAGSSDGQGEGLREMLLSARWCTISVSGGGSASSNSITKYQFFADGSYSTNSTSESFSTGQAGTVAGQSGSGGSGRWKIEGGRLFMAEGWEPFEVVPIEIRYTSGGTAYLFSDGKEYQRCEIIEKYWD